MNKFLYQKTKQFGINNPHYKGGKPHCKCGKIIGYESKHCRQCWGKIKSKEMQGSGNSFYHNRHTLKSRYIISKKAKKRLKISKNNPNFKNLFTKSFLIKEYIKHKKSMTQIAKENNCIRYTVRRYLKQFKINIITNRIKLGLYNPMKGKHHTKEAKEKISKSNLGKRMSKKVRKLFSKQRKGKSTAKRISKHHINLNKKDNRKKNILTLTGSEHTKLHINAYNYLVEIKQIGNYIKWFKRKYLKKRGLIK